MESRRLTIRSIAAASAYKQVIAYLPVWARRPAVHLHPHTGCLRLDRVAAADSGRDGVRDRVHGAWAGVFNGPRRDVRESNVVVGKWI